MEKVVVAMAHHVDRNTREYKYRNDSSDNLDEIVHHLDDATVYNAL